MENKTNNEILNKDISLEPDKYKWYLDKLYPNKILSEGINGLDPLTGECVIGGTMPNHPARNKNAELICAAVNSCKQINPTNPINAALAYGEVLEALRILLKSHYRLNGASVFSNEVEQLAEKAIEKATKQ